MTEMYKSIAIRFLKGFLAGGVASVVTFLSSGVKVTEFADLKALAFPLVMAFLTGSMLGIEKAFNWQNNAPTLPQN